MQRKLGVMVAIGSAALIGVLLLTAMVLWLLWRESIAAEERAAGQLAEALGRRSEAIILDLRNQLHQLDQLDSERCGPAHLEHLQNIAMARPYLRALGYWQADRRMCGVGFLGAGMRPPRADRIYDSGLIAWWPSAHTEVGGVQLFLMRFGDHDAAIDPRMLLDAGSARNGAAGLWVEGLRMAATPWDAELPLPKSLPIGLTIDRAQRRVISRFSHHDLIPIDVVAIEHLDSFWERHLPTLVAVGGGGLLMISAWLYAALRYSRHRLSLPTRLRIALRRGDIGAHYQPVIELASGRCVGAEALARWRDRSEPAISPEQFIPVAERVGLAHRITLAVLDTTLSELAPLLRESPALSINLNLAPADLTEPHFANQLQTALARAELPSQAIKLEITERALVNTDSARTLIRGFRQLGHQIAVDDFGTGYSSLSYLASFELDVLKIDKSFVDAIGTDSATSHVILHVIEMARSLGLKTVAEGVESQAQIDWLRQHGVDYVQGYYHSPPLDARQFAEFVAQTASR